ncbi:unnamed protein product [Rhizoctonia solani]|uniref:F-box domain-containing protein n=1 Tax=Rhizoctonia solani TaxID=456999 RepID=A0A8H2WRP2_9AGAM|nr:unnamed protein product [Rhizoctonia solani]
MIRQWEEAGISLVDAANKYLSLCLSLNTSARLSRANKGIKEALAFWMDSALSPGGLHSILDQKIAQSRSLMAQTRNRILAASIYQFPAEILSEIFLNVIYDKDNFEGDPVYITTGIKLIYQRLHQILGVCSNWRNVGIACPSLWSFIPVIHEDDGFSLRMATNLSLQRAPGANLYLAAILPPYPPYKLFDDLAKHRSRFRAINMVIPNEAPRQLEHFFDRMLKPASHPPSELSLYLRRPSDSDDDIDTALNLKQRLFCELLPQFTEFLVSLSKIRFSGAGVRWDQVIFSDRLIELQLEDFVLGHKPDLDTFLTALSSASKLQVLSLTSITTFNITPEIPEHSDRNPTISLPGLKRLHIEDLYFNTLRDVIGSISQGQHQLTLVLTTNSLQIAAPAGLDFQDASINALCEVVSSTPVDTLLLCGRRRGGWLDEEELEALLQAAPSVKTLKMSHWRFRSSECRVLTRPQSSDGAFPAIKNMHLCWAGIIDQEGFKSMVTSHPIQRMVLGGYTESEPGDFFDPFRGSEEIVAWLDSNIPNFRLYDLDYEPPEFKLTEWQLW